MGREGGGGGGGRGLQNRTGSGVDKSSFTPTKKGWF